MARKARPALQAQQVRPAMLVRLEQLVPRAILARLVHKVLLVLQVLRDPKAFRASKATLARQVLRVKLARPAHKAQLDRQARPVTRVR